MGEPTSKQDSENIESQDQKREKEMEEHLSQLEKDRKELSQKKALSSSSTKHKTPKETADVKRSVLESSINADPETISEILSLDSNKEISEQRSAFNKLRVVSVTMFGKIFESGAKKSDLSDFASIEKLSGNTKTPLNATEKVALKKLKELATAKDSKLSKDIEKIWDGWIETAHNSHIRTSSAKEVIERTLNDEKIEDKEAESWVSEQFSKKNIVRTISIIGLGSIAAYTIYCYASKGKDDSNGKAMDKIGLGSWKSKLAVASLSLLGLGGILGSKKIGAFLEKSGKMPGGVLGGIVTVLSGGKIADAVEKAKEETKENVKDKVDKAKESASEMLNKKINFEEAKERLLKVLPSKPSWLKDSKFEDMIKDLNIDPDKYLSWEKYAGPGGGGLLLYDWMSRKKKLDKTTAKIMEKYLKSEQTYGLMDSMQDKEHLKEYGEFAPAKDVLADFNKSLEQKLIEIKNYIKENPEIVGIAGAALASIVVFRKALKAGIKGGYEAFITLAKTSFKTVGKFPITSLFAVCAVLYADDRYQLKNRAGEIMVPKDPENLKKYLSKKIEDTGEWAHDLPHIPEGNVKEAVDIFTIKEKRKKYFNQMPNIIEIVGVSAADMLTLSPKELIYKSNEKGLHILQNDFRALQLDYEENTDEFDQYSELLKKVKKIQFDYKRGVLLKKEHLLDELQEIANPLGIFLLVEEGYIVWIKKDESGMIKKGPKKIIVDPSLKFDEQLSKARRFVTEDGAMNAAGRAAAIPFQDARILLHNILFEDAKTYDEAGNIVEGKLRGGGHIVIQSGKAILVESIKGATHRYALGPLRVFKHIISGISGDFSAVDAAMDYGEGILPVTILGLTTTMIRGDWKNLSKGKILWNTAIYPFKAIKDVLLITAKHVLPNLRDPKAIVRDPMLKVSSDFWQVYYKNKTRASMLSLSKYKKHIRSEYNDLSKLYMAKKYIHESQYHSWGQERYCKLADDSLSGMGKSMETMDWRVDTLDTNLRKIDAEIAARELQLKHIHKTDKLSAALKHVEKGKIKRAKKILDEVGYKGAVTKEALEREIRAHEQKIPNVKPDTVQRKLSPKEQKEAVKEVKSAEKEMKKHLNDKQKEINALNDKAIKERKPLNHTDIKKQREAINTKYDKKFAETFEKWSKNIDGIDDALLRKHKIDPQKMRDRKFDVDAKVSRFRGKGRLRKIGRGVGAAILGLVGAYGIGKGIEYLKGTNEVLDLDKIYGKETDAEKESRVEKNKNLEEDPKSHKDIMYQIDNYFKSIDASYNDIFELLSPKKLLATSEDELIRKVDASAKTHSQNTEKLKSFLQLNRDAIVLFYKKHPEINKDKDIGRFFALGFDKERQRPYLKYADESDFKTSLYENADFLRKYGEKLIKGEEIDWTDHAWDTAKYITPLYGTGLDAVATYDAVNRGQWGEAAVSAGWTAIGATSDVLLVLGFFTLGTTAVAGGALKGVRAAVGTTKGVVKGTKAASKAAKISKTARIYAKVQKHIGKITMGAMGADIGRALVTPNRTETYTF